MKVLLFGATGMIGQGVLRECLLDPEVTRVVTVGRRLTGQRHAKLSEIVHADLAALDSLAPQLTGFDACFFCVGVSALGMTEEKYARATYDLTLGVAKTLLRMSPDMTFIYVSGTGTDSSERGRMMWARVKGRTENALLSLPFRAAYMFRPGAVIPLHGIRSSTRWYNVIYAVTKPIYPILSRVAPAMVTTTEKLGRAMIAVARNGYSTHVLEMADINRLAWT
ncbi:MAG: NAD-dependent epimerase/dehydratase family protein [Gemmatimonadota bacterium]|nr:NAD-dependent epimerase/dehydratase family protein [Gemmatimonadota bacterium]